MRLFWRIFLSFWLSTILMFAMLLGESEFLPVTFPGDHLTSFQPQEAQAILVQAVNAYEQQGVTGLTSNLQKLDKAHHRSVFVFDQTGKVLAGDGTPPPSLYGQLSRAVMQSGHAEVQRYVGLRTLFVCPIQSATGRRYAAIMPIFEPGNRLRRMRFWVNMMLAMVPAAFVCMLLSLYLTRPITRLRASAQRLAGGDLNARAVPLGSTRRDELGDLARDFDAMAAQIQMLLTAQRRFVADVSHELGAPLTRMHLALALLQRQFAGNNNGELKRIERETGKLSNLVQQLLLLAGMEAGRCPAETLSPISIGSICESIIEDANFEAAHAGCHVAGSRQDVTFLAYPQLLRRAIDNVLRNSIRYAPAGTEVDLNCTVDHDGQRVILEILDHGPGVPESMLKDIFRPFFRTAPGRESNSGGTGLGLAIASEAIRLHDGTITAQNRKNGGLQVTVALPLRIPNPENESQPSVTEV